MGNAGGGSVASRHGTVNLPARRPDRPTDGRGSDRNPGGGGRLGMDEYRWRKRPIKWATEFCDLDTGRLIEVIGAVLVLRPGGSWVHNPPKTGGESKPQPSIRGGGYCGSCGTNSPTRLRCHMANSQNKTNTRPQTPLSRVEPPILLSSGLPDSQIFRI